MTSTTTMTKISTPTTTSARGRALVRMFEPVTASHWTSPSSHSNSSNSNLIVSDLRQLLLMMDIGSCASAEKHTRVNCVTASMGDVVIENCPCVGDLLELRAVPVSVGRTSLDIAVLVVAHGNSTHSDDEDNNDSPVQTRRVCEAFFTYVTTRGPNGEKRFAPPIEETTNTNDAPSTISKRQQGKLRWERTLAHFRKELIRSEQAVAKVTTTCSSNKDMIISRPILECSEVVLPQHQNHMDHLFGGVVMGWMCKSVLAGCVKACRLPINKFRIVAIHRVDFPTGADVSDHVFFRPRITAIMGQGRSAGFELKVGKRSIAGQQQDGNDETLMNVGHFLVTGLLSYGPEDDCEYDDEKSTAATTAHSKNSISFSSKKNQLASNIAPFAKLLRTHTHLYSNDSCNHNTTERDMAYQRWKSLLARRCLFDGLYESVHWDTALKVQAPLLTILSVLRLFDEYENSMSSSSLDGDGDGDVDGGGRPAWKVIDLKETNHDQHKIEWTPGQVNTVLLRGKTVISRTKQYQVHHPDDQDENKNNSSAKNRDCLSFLDTLYHTLSDKRPQWDPMCVSVTILEKSDDDDDDEDLEEEKRNNGVAAVKPEWDIREYELKTSTAQARFCLLRAGSYVNYDDKDDGNKSRIGVLASRSVIHDKSEAKNDNRILPSGWLFKMIDKDDTDKRDNKDDNDEDLEFIEITYIAEHDFNMLRETAFGGNKDISDEFIANFTASYIGQWFTNLYTYHA